MISSLKKQMQAGFSVLQQHTQLALVAILLFIFPILFVFLLQGFFSAADANIETAQKQRVGLLHDVLSSLIQETDTAQSLESVITPITLENQDIEEIRVIRELPEGLYVEYSLEESLIGTNEPNSLFFTTSIGAPNTSLIFESFEGRNRTWQVVRKIVTADAIFYLYSEHNFKSSDGLMTARKQQAYLALSGIFIFLIALAYWLARQINWQRKYLLVRNELQERDLFTNMIAHEFRTPLTAINGYASFLQEDVALSLDNQRYVTSIRVSTERLIHLVNDFLEVARIQTGNVSLNKQSVNIFLLLDQICTSLQPLAKEKGLNLSYIKLVRPVMLTIDPNRLTQVLTNIITNSIKYTDSGEVTVAVEQTATAVILTIKDTGTGISAADQEKLFKPFSRVGNVDATNTVGSGLGMWITKHLVELQGGVITLESIKGVGTHVVITFKQG